MTDHEKLVMRNIIYAVETGGQVYGQKNYADFTEAYTNSSSEHAITIGAGQWYGNEARTLLLNIKATDAATFKNMILPVLLQILPKQTGQTTGFPKLLQRLKLL